MAAYVAGDVTYTLKNQRRMGNSKVQNRVSIAFGDGAKTYATGGVPFSTGACGCPNTIESLIVADAGTSGYQFNYISSTNKLQIFVAAAHNHSLLLKNAAQADGATTRVNAAASNALGANTGADVIIAGVASTTAANGGIVTATPALSWAELANGSAPAALSLIAEIIGW